MTDEHGTGHDDVMSSLLSLQRRLRGDEGVLGEASGGTVAAVPEATRPHHETVTVSEHDLSILMTPSSPQAEEERLAPVTQLPTAVADDRIAVLADRLSRLEEDLSGVMGALEGVREEVAADTDAKIHAVRDDVQRSVAQRLEAVESRVVDELRLQRGDLAGLVDERFRSMNDEVRRAIREVAETDTPD